MAVPLCTLAWLRAHALSPARTRVLHAHRRWLQRCVRTLDATTSPPPHTTTAVVLPYGSTLSGLAFDDADVDYALVVLPSQQAPTADAQAALLARVHAHLQEQQQRHVAGGGVLTSQRVLHARVPVLRYTHTGFVHGDMATTQHDTATTATSATVLFDVSLSLHGVCNSLMLRRYCAGDATLRCGLLTLKQWAREARVCDPYRGMASSYMLIILYVHYARATQRTRMCVSERDVAADVQQRIAQLQRAEAVDDDDVDEVAAPLSLLDDDDVSEARVHDDVRGFFAYYSDDRAFDFDVHVADVRQHEPLATRDAWLQLLSKHDARTRHALLGHGVLLVRDPFESHNLARGIDFFGAERLREALRLAAAA